MGCDLGLDLYVHCISVFVGSVEAGGAGVFHLDVCLLVLRGVVFGDCFRRVKGTGVVVWGWWDQVLEEEGSKWYLSTKQIEQTPETLFFNY